MSEPEDEVSGFAGAISAANPAAVRGPNGIWNEESLPVLEWEDAGYRVVLPIALQQALGINAPVLRVAQVKVRVMRATHARDQAVVQRLSWHVAQWQYVGNEINSREARKRILFQDRGRWYAMTVGQDTRGSWNVITVFGGSRPGFLENRLRGLADVVAREK